jgi:uncharacterized Fe-S center protein
MKRRQHSVFFASAHPDRLDRDQTLPARFIRMLDRLPIRERIKGKTVAVKMHLGGELGYSTIHPLFVAILVAHLKSGGPKRVFITDDKEKNGHLRGYAPETVGAKIIPAFGRSGKLVYRKRTGWKHLKTAQVSKLVLDADVLVNFSHVKGHGDCGFGGACKNLAMGCVSSKTKGDLHSLEGELTWDKAKCIHCRKCLEECPTQANSFTENGDYNIFWHHCRMCRHCALICPTKAITITNRDFDLFQEGLARVAKLVVDNFGRGNVFHINVLTHITTFCDCWGLTTPALVPDVGIFASEDIVAVEHASLRAIKTENIIPGSVTPPFELGKGRHLFEKLHSRDPYAQVRSLEKLGAGKTKYSVMTVK